MTSLVSKLSGSLKNEKIAFIGTGRMASAIIATFIKNKVYTPAQIITTHHRTDKVHKLNNTLGVKVIASNVKAVKNADIIFLCVRPQQMLGIAEEIQPYLKRNQIVISIAIGVPIIWLRKKLCNSGPIFHVHPASLVMASSPGISYIIYEKDVNPEILSKIETIFSVLGKVINIDETMVGNYAILSGCAPAFFAEIARVWRNLAIQQGISSQYADLIIAQIFKGLAYGLEEEKLTLEILIDKIATPNGLTKSGLAIMNEIVKDDDKSKTELFLKSVIEGCMSKIKIIAALFE